MKWLCREIRKRGFKPGLWMAPFGTGSTDFYSAHKDWFLHDEAGQPIGCWNGRYTLDPTVKAARDHLQGIFDKAAHDWGYEFFKIDGMSGRGPGCCAHLYEMPHIRKRFADPACPNPFKLCVKAFRDGIGEDRIFLAWEFWTGSWQGEAAGSFGMRVPARGVRLVALRPVSDRAQFLSSDRHISQGGVELRDQAWSEGACTATVDVVGGFPLTAFFAVPDGVQVKAVEAPGAMVGTCPVADGRVLAVTHSCGKSQAVPVTLLW